MAIAPETNPVSADAKNIGIIRLVTVNALMVVAMLVIGLANIAWAERLTFNNGLGWDGAVYASWVRDFYQSIFVRGVPDYYAHRILPSAIVHYCMRALGVPLADRNIILSFDIYNLSLLLLSTYLWGRIADKLQIRNQGKWLGFCFLFLNYAILKNNFYHSVLTDTSAFALGIIMFYCFITGNRIGLIAIMLAGGFTWPTVLPMAALLYVFPYQPLRVKDESTAAPPRYKLRIVFASGVCIFVFIGYAYLLQPDRFAKWLQILGWGLRVNTSVLYLSVLAVILYLFFSLLTAADRRLFDPAYILQAIRWKRVAVAVVAWAIVKLAVGQLASGEVISWDVNGFVVQTFLSSVTEPSIFLVAHVIYYGPAILLLVFLWNPFCRSIVDFGPGLRLFMILNVILSINPQSRYQINIVTTFIIVLVRMLDRRGLQYLSTPFWALLCLFYSKFWYIFNSGPQVYDGMESLLRFPLQHYFMNSGPWMSHEMYLVQGGVVALTAIMLYFLVIKNRYQIHAFRAFQPDAFKQEE